MSKKKDDKKDDKKETKRESLGPLVITLFISVFIVIPLSAVFIMSAKEFNNQLIKSTLWIVLIPIFISLFAILINWIFVRFKIINLRSFNFSIPTIFIFLGLIYLGLCPMKFWIKYLIAPVIGIFIAVINNIIFGKIEDKLEAKKTENIYKTDK